jgi:hypothetical protein
LYSNELANKGFSIWRAFGKKSLEKVPNEIGVYVFRKSGAQFFGRLKGDSDILYIGSTTKGLRNRLLQYLTPGPSQWTNIRLNEYANRNPVEFSFLANDEPKSFEYELLIKYMSEHEELPPLNFSSIRTLHKKITDGGIGTDEWKVTK